MPHLILYSHQLHTNYIEEIQPDKVTVLVTKEQFEFVPYHQFRILYHRSASFHFAREHNIEYIYLATWHDYFDTLDDLETILYYEPTDIWMKEQLEDATAHLTVQVHRDLNFYFPNIEEEFSSSPYKLDPI